VPGTTKLSPQRIVEVMQQRHWVAVWSTGLLTVQSLALIMRERLCMHLASEEDASGNSERAYKLMWWRHIVIFSLYCELRSKIAVTDLSHQFWTICLLRILLSVVGVASSYKCFSCLFSYQLRFWPTCCVVSVSMEQHGLRKCEVQRVDIFTIEHVEMEPLRCRDSFPVAEVHRMWLARRTFSLHMFFIPSPPNASRALYSGLVVQRLETHT